MYRLWQQPQASVRDHENRLNQRHDTTIMKYKIICLNTSTYTYIYIYIYHCVKRTHTPGSYKYRSPKIVTDGHCFFTAITPKWAYSVCFKSKNSRLAIAKFYTLRSWFLGSSRPVRTYRDNVIIKTKKYTYHYSVVLRATTIRRLRIVENWFLPIREVILDLTSTMVRTIAYSIHIYNFYTAALDGCF